jgi:ribonuclease HI
MSIIRYPTLHIWTDGGSRSNPGPAAIGVVIRTPEGVDIWTESRYLGSPISNNQAEYQAFIAGILQAKALGATSVYCFLDSKLVVEQLNGRYKVKDVGMQQQWQIAQQNLSAFTAATITYVPRAENADADRLVNQALDKAVGRS